MKYSSSALFNLTLLSIFMPVNSQLFKRGISEPIRPIGSYVKEGEISTETKKRIKEINVQASRIQNNAQFIQAVYKHDVNKMQRHLAAGADVNLRTEKDFQTPLMILVADPNAGEALSFLLQQPNVDLDTTDVAGNTPLDIAVQTGNVKAAKLLLDHGINIFSYPDLLSNPIIMQAFKEHIEEKYLKQKEQQQEEQKKIRATFQQLAAQTQK